MNQTPVNYNHEFTGVLLLKVVVLRLFIISQTIKFDYLCTKIKDMENSQMLSTNILWFCNF